MWRVLKAGLRRIPVAPGCAQTPTQAGVLLAAEVLREQGWVRPKVDFRPLKGPLVGEEGAGDALRSSQELRLCSEGPGFESWLCHL